jgi:transcriptional regulator with XRE-family HTH domain
MSRVEKILGRQVALHRKAARLTQARLAERLDVAVETISRLERGAVVPPITRLDEIASVLRVPLVDLFRSSGRGNERDLAIDRMVFTLVKCAPDDVDLLTAVAKLVLSHFATAGKRPGKRAARSSVTAGRVARRRPRR